MMASWHPDRTIGLLNYDVIIKLYWATIIQAVHTIVQGQNSSFHAFIILWPIKTPHFCFQINNKSWMVSLLDTCRQKRVIWSLLQEIHCCITRQMQIKIASLDLLQTGNILNSHVLWESRPFANEQKIWQQTLIKFSSTLHCRRHRFHALLKNFTLKTYQNEYWMDKNVNTSSSNNIDQ